MAKSSPKGAVVAALDAKTVDDLRRGGSFDDYMMSTAPEARALGSSSVMLKVARAGAVLYDTCAVT